MIAIASVSAGKWEAAGSAWQSDYRHWVDETRRHELREFVAAVKEEGFIESFGVFDLLFFALAIMSAYGIASGAGGD